MDIKLPGSPGILKSVARLDHFRGTWAGGSVIPPERLRRIREACRIQSVAASLRIAGVKVSDAEVTAVLQGQTITLRERSEVLGYARAFDQPFPTHGPLVTSDEIRRLHAVVMGSQEESPAPTPWRSEPYHLEVFDGEGQAVGRIFQTLPPRLLPETLEELVTWLEIELREGENHPILTIGTFTLYFIAACPFAGGNGRTAHLLVLHLLQRAGYDYLPYASLERILEETRREYFEAVDAAETHLWTGDADLEPWLNFFLGALEQHCERVQSKIDLERRALEFTPLQRKILETVREHGLVGAGLLIEATGANRNTLKDNLRRMVNKGLLERLGERRGARYRLATGEPRGAGPQPASATALETSE